MKKILLGLLIVIVLLFALAFGLFAISKSRSFQFFGGLINNIKTDKNIVALTFDDGPTSGNTQKILDILKNHNIQATFFVIGQEIENNPGELQKIISDGNQVGNHSYSHQRMLLKSPSWVREEIQKTDDLIRGAGYGSGEIYFRTPYGKRLFITPYVLRSLQKPNIFFDVEPETYVKTSGDILNYTLTNTHSGSIILIHAMYGEDNQSLAVLESIITGLQNRGFNFVAVDQLLEQTNTSIKFR